MTTTVTRITNAGDFIAHHGKSYRDENGTLRARDGARFCQDSLCVRYLPAPQDPRGRAKAAYQFDSFFFSKVKSALEGAAGLGQIVVMGSNIRVGGQVQWIEDYFGPPPHSAGPGWRLDQKAAVDRLRQVYEERKAVLAESRKVLQETAPDLLAHLGSAGL